MSTCVGPFVKTNMPTNVIQHICGKICEIQICPQIFYRIFPQFPFKMLYVKYSKKESICEVLIKRYLFKFPPKKFLIFEHFYPLNPPDRVKNFSIPLLNTPLVPSIPKRYHMLGDSDKITKTPCYGHS